MASYRSPSLRREESCRDRDWAARTACTSKSKLNDLLLASTAKHDHQPRLLLCDETTHQDRRVGSEARLDVLSNQIRRDVLQASRPLSRPSDVHSQHQRRRPLKPLNRLSPLMLLGHHRQHLSPIQHALLVPQRLERLALLQHLVRHLPLLLRLRHTLRVRPRVDDNLGLERLGRSSRRRQRALEVVDAALELAHDPVVPRGNFLLVLVLLPLHPQHDRLGVLSLLERRFEAILVSEIGRAHV